MIFNLIKSVGIVGEVTTATYDETNGELLITRGSEISTMYNEDTSELTVLHNAATYNEETGELTI
jgi:hypothetical protein